MRCHEQHRAVPLRSSSSFVVRRLESSSQPKCCADEHRSSMNSSAAEPTSLCWRMPRTQEDGLRAPSPPLAAAPVSSLRRRRRLSSLSSYVAPPTLRESLLNYATSQPTSASLPASELKQQRPMTDAAVESSSTLLSGLQQVVLHNSRAMEEHSRLLQAMMEVMASAADVWRSPPNHNSAPPRSAVSASTQTDCDVQQTSCSFTQDAACAASAQVLGGVDEEASASSGAADAEDIFVL